MIESLVNQSTKDNSLTTASFDNLLAFLGPDRESAAPAYLDLRRALFTFFAMRGAASPDEMVAETINRAARLLSEGARITAENPSSYFYAVARDVWSGSLAGPSMPLSLSDYDSAAGARATPPDPMISVRKRIESEARCECLEKCLDQFSTEERELIVSYYRLSGGEKTEKRKSLAARLGLSGNALRQKVARLRGRLAECINNCQRSHSHPDLK
jgi:DNA-directed RNA polymerase specialized sigma24 family protein